MELTKEYFDRALKNNTKNLLKKLVTKEEFEKRIDKLVTKEEFEKRLDKLVTKEELNNRLNAQTIELKAYTKEQIDDLARMTKKSFDHVDEQLSEISTRLDVREKIKQFDKKFQKLEDALHIKL
ncbi:MAG TPA: hypothetical protein VEC17_00395 [Candidatus Binatia bacterium]|nr:hypothetical protein [Candidatus Binatia bacterium]